MKKFFSLMVVLFASMTLYAQQGHFFINLEKDDVSVLDVDRKFNSWLDLPQNTTFTLFRDETDNLGIRHLSYQQYVNGISVCDGIVLVHVKEGKVCAINGDIMESANNLRQLQKKISPIHAVKKVRRDAKSADTELKIIRVNINGEDIYRYVYEVFAENFTSKYYVDAETGDIIKKLSLIYNVDVAGTASTMYNGVQAITCYEKDGKYFLMDEARGIITLDATNNTYKIDYDKVKQGKDEATQRTLLTEELNNLIQNCSYIYNSSPTWESDWNLILKSITITLVASDLLNIGELTADVYIKIKDKNGNLLYTSNYYDDPTFPVTFTISPAIILTTPPYLVEFWDYDPIGDDDLIDIYNIDNIAGENHSYDFVSKNNVCFGTYRIESTGKQPLFDAHWGMEKTLDFYKNTFNRISYDNKGSIVYNLVNQPNDTGLFFQLPTNASAISCSPFPMVYGMGLFTSKDESFYLCSKPIVSIDIMAHEFSHLVTANNGNGGLNYIGESGALNESFSDIMGIAVKKYVLGNNNWLIGDDVMINVSNLRSMKNPNVSNDGIKGGLGEPQPDTYHGTYWADVTNTSIDKGGVHANSGVQNYWFYLLSEGGTGTNDINNTYNVTGIGIDKAVQIAYRNLIYYLTPDATFGDARNGSIQAAIDLYGRDSKEHQSVVNAWFAVGVGDKYVAPQNTISISAKMPSNWGSTISAWVWENGHEGLWATLQKDGEWYSYTTSAILLNIVFVNGTTWNGDNNQSVDISVSENTCIQLSNNSTGKRNYTVIDCEDGHETSVNEIKESSNSKIFKLVKDGQLFILRDDKVYTVTGQEVK